MYPLIRFAKEMIKFRNAPRLRPDQPHVSTHICWPWDLDPWMELNNGRTLTLYDLGRFPLAQRSGLISAARKNGWGVTVAGNSVRYRRRVRGFDRFTMVSQLRCWDQKFLYVDQSIWRKGECLNQMLVRLAVTSKAGLVQPGIVMQALGQGAESPPAPDWIAAWIQADALRPWPPEIHLDPKRDLPA